jgi:GNAT superfamily N-acetyltransferase
MPGGAETVDLALDGFAPDDAVPAAPARSLTVRPIRLPAEAALVIEFPWTVYRGDRHWVPPLRFERAAFLDPERNPYFRVADVQFFVAERGREVVGTISAHVDHGYQAAEPGAGFFGFFEFVDDVTVARELIGAAAGWLRSRGMTRMLGPLNFNTNHECGLLVDGFDGDPVVYMTYNPRYYPERYEELGLAKAKDLLAYWKDAEPIAPRLEAAARWFARRHPEVRIRPADTRNFRAELDLFKSIYNDAWEDNWGFVRFTDAEFDKIAEGLRPMIDPRLCYVAEVDGDPAAFSLTLRDFNQVVKPMNGRRFPVGWWHWLTRRGRVRTARIFALGVRRQYQHLPIGLPLYLRTWEAGLAMGLTGAEAGWVLEDNHRMRGPLEKLGAKAYRTYRIYETAL